jgi:hypothetical protein
MVVHNGTLYLCRKIASVIVAMKSGTVRWAERVASIRVERNKER